MQFSFGFNINLMSLFGCLKAPEKFCFPINANLCLPKPTIGFDAKKAGLVIASWFSFVLNVHGLRNIAQVGKLIVRSVSVYMVNVSIRPFAINVKPNKSMNESHVTINHQLQVSASWISCNLASFHMTFVDAARHDASLRIVGKKLVESRLCKLFSPHQSERHPESCSKRWMKPPVPRRVSCQSILQ